MLPQIREDLSYYMRSGLMIRYGASYGYYICASLSIVGAIKMELSYLVRSYYYIGAYSNNKELIYI